MIFESKLFSQLLHLMAYNYLLKVTKVSSLSFMTRNLSIFYSNLKELQGSINSNVQSNFTKPAGI